MILLIDNYDSFSYNLYQLIGGIDPDIKVVRNDQISLEEIAALAPSHIVLSPGPGRPRDAGICEEVVLRFAGKIPILGVCLGHQAICEAYGATVSYAKKLMHGKQSNVTLDCSIPLFYGLPKVIPCARYHSLAAVADTIPPCLKVIATADDGEVMAVKHKDYPVYGLQFHPESIMTPEGHNILVNFLAGGDKKMIKEAIIKLSDRNDLSYDETVACVNEIMDGNTTQVETAGFLMGLSVKGETTDEIAAAARAMRDHATPMPHEGEVLEIVGTGGDRSNTINVSTTAALVIAAGGVQVAKHGNTAASSKCGAADCLEALGVDTKLAPEKMAKVLADTGMCFMHAQVYHSAMKYVGPVRKALGCHTVFNVLGPLTNPASNTMQVMGVYKEELVKPMADVLSRLGVRRGVVVYGQDVMDEVSISAPTSICEFNGDERLYYVITPEDCGLTRAQKSDVVGGDPAYNAQVARDILSGKERGPKRDIVLMNAGCGLYIADKAPSIPDGVKLAAELIDSGKAIAKLDEFIAACRA
ncbi:MAG: anthranilate phosphoribosyltransferase [Clostridiales bacterium]|nr:anthranilate phosphoribosyltransferase [Clostridiales bacterium]